MLQERNGDGGDVKMIPLMKNSFRQDAKRKLGYKRLMGDLWRSSALRTASV
jgi:hypothetical protein